MRGVIDMDEVDVILREANRINKLAGAALMYELALLDALLDGERESEDIKGMAFDAFLFHSALPVPKDPIRARLFFLNAGMLACLGGRCEDARRWMALLLEKSPLPAFCSDEEKWGRRVWLVVLDVWLAFFYREGWSKKDSDEVLGRVASLRESESECEMMGYLESLYPENRKGAALELIGLYHLARSGEIMAHCLLSEVRGFVRYRGEKGETRRVLKMHFDEVFSVCKKARLLDLSSVSQLLVPCVMGVLLKRGGR